MASLQLNVWWSYSHMRGMQRESDQQTQCSLESAVCWKRTEHSWSSMLTTYSLPRTPRCLQPIRLSIRPTSPPRRHRERATSLQSHNPSACLRLQRRPQRPPIATLPQRSRLHPPQSRARCRQWLHRSHLRPQLGTRPPKDALCGNAPDPRPRTRH